MIQVPIFGIVFLHPYIFVSITAFCYRVTWPPPPAADGSAVPPPPGLSERAVRRVLGDPPLPAERLERLKAGLVRFLVSSQLAAASVAPHLLVAQADTRFSVANLAGMELKRLR